MPVFQITYDLSGEPPEKYAELKAAIERFDCVHDQYSTWFIAAAGTPEQVHAHFRPHVQTPGKLTVVQVEKAVATFGFPVFNWLRRHLPEPPSAPPGGIA